MTENTYTYSMGRRPLVDPPKPFVVRIPLGLQGQVRQRAKASGVKINDLVQRALELYLSRPRKTKPVVREMVPRKTGHGRSA